jgi:hypothetical protein
LIDEHWFDVMSRLIVPGSTRRAIVRAAVALGTGLALGTAANDGFAADPCNTAIPTKNQPLQLRAMWQEVRESRSLRRRCLRPRRRSLRRRADALRRPMRQHVEQSGPLRRLRHPLSGRPDLRQWPLRLPER